MNYGIINKSFLIIFFIFLIDKKIKIENSDKICLCTTGKRENLYVREYIEHYQKYGVDKFFIYDNNDINGEKFDDVINDYINNKFVEIINFRGLLSPQIKGYNDCLKKNYKLYKWLIFYDMDEFIYLKNFNNIKDFLNNEKFNKCQRMQLNWIFHTDNNNLHYDNRKLAIRFPKKENTKKILYQGIKSILRGRINIKINNVHTLSKRLISCNGFGQKIENKTIETNKPDFHYYYIDHYYSKSTEEFLNKLKRGSAVHGFSILHIVMRIRVYFQINEITKEKLDYIEEEIKLNMSEYRNRIIK
jgi:hypothetical protein